MPTPQPVLHPNEGRTHQNPTLQTHPLPHFHPAPIPTLQNFDEAQELFEELLQRDPHRIEVGPPASRSAFACRLALALAAAMHPGATWHCCVAAIVGTCLPVAHM